MARLLALAAALAVVVAVAAAAQDSSELGATAGPRPDAVNGMRIVIDNKGDKPLECQRITLQGKDGGEAPQIVSASSPNGFVDPAGNTASAQVTIPPGGSLTIDIQTEQAVEDGLPVKVDASETCEPGSDKTVNITYAAQEPEEGGADLEVTLRPHPDPPGLSEDSYPAPVHYVLQATVRNHGPQSATGVELKLRFPALPPGSATDAGLYDGATGALDADTVPEECLQPRAPRGTITCKFEDPIAPGGREQREVLVELSKPGNVQVEGEVSSEVAPDPDPAPNRAEHTVRVDDIPDTGDADCGGDRRARAARCNTRPRYVPAGSPPIFKGQAHAARRVEVAIGRLVDGAKFSAAGCLWLVNKKGKTKREAAKRGKCSQPAAWLRARGRSDWTLRLKKALPEGRYVLLTRAIGRRGLREGGFSPADGNQLTLIVR